METMLDIVNDTPKLVVVKNLCQTSLDVALNPELALDEAYYAITKGEEHVFTVVYAKGNTFSFHWGRGGYTLIDTSTKRLKERVLAFLRERKVLIGLTSKPTKVSIWPTAGDREHALRIDGSQGDCDFETFKGTLEETKAEAKRLLGDRLEFKEHVSPITGHHSWVATLEGGTR